MTYIKIAPFTKFDVVDYLKTEKDIADYFEACLEEAGDDTTFITAAIGDIARARGMSKLARKTGISREALYVALSKKGNPEFGTIFKVIKALGLKIHITPA